MCRDIGTSRCWSRVGDVEGPSGCQSCCCGGANPRRSGRPIRPFEVVGYPLGGPIPNLEGDTAFEAQSRRPCTSPTVIPAEVVELAVNLRSELSAQAASTPAPTPCAGTSNSATRSPFRPRRSAAVSSIWVSWSPTRRNGRSRPMSGSRPICLMRCGSPTSPTGASPQVPTPRSSPG